MTAAGAFPRRAVTVIVLALLCAAGYGLAPAGKVPPSPAPEKLVAAREKARTAKLEIPDSVEVVRDVQYGTGAAEPLVLDIYRPKWRPKQRANGPLPALMWVHGGAWESGDKNQREPVWFAPHGYLVISVNYRLSPEHQFPAHIEDVKCAVRWLRANARKYNVDPKRIGAWGASAGGHLVGLLHALDEGRYEGSGGHAGQGSRVQAVAAYFGVFDFVDFAEQIRASGRPPDPSGRPSTFARLLGDEYRDNPEIYRAASPITHLSKDDPPLLLVHGEKDKLVPIRQSELMLEAARKTGVPAELVRVKNADHAFTQVGDEPISPTLDEIRRRVLAFFDQHLKE